MIIYRKSEERRHIKSAHQDTWLTFDQDSNVDPMPRGFHALETFNEEHPAPEMGLLHHRQGDIEIITYVRTGSLIHQDRPSGLGRIEAGEFQHARAKPGIMHRFVNASLIDTANVFQSCLTLDDPTLGSLLQLERYPVPDRDGILRLVASAHGGSGSLRIHPDVRMYSSLLLLGHHMIHELDCGRGAWLHVVKGRIQLYDHYLGTGDGAAFDHEPAVSFTAQQPSEILLFDLA